MYSAINGDLRLFARFSAGAKHPFGIELHRDLSLRVDGDHASFAAQYGEFSEYHFPRCLNDPTATEAHSRADIVGNGGAQEYLAVSRGGDCA